MQEHILLAVLRALSIRFFPRCNQSVLPKPHRQTENLRGLRHLPIFLPKGHSLDQYELWIYDKWGNNVFYTNEIDPIIKSPSEGWNGNDIKTGEPVPMGVYAWRIRAVFDDGTRWTGQKSVYDITKAYGTLTLIR